MTITKLYVIPFTIYSEYSVGTNEHTFGIMQLETKTYRNIIYIIVCLVTWYTSFE